jgi:hypothetical protein
MVHDVKQLSTNPRGIGTTFVFVFTLGIWSDGYVAGLPSASRKWAAQGQTAARVTYALNLGGAQ